MENFVFPSFNGALATVDKNESLATIDRKGNIKLASKRGRREAIPHPKIWFLRGIEYLIFGTYFFFLAQKRAYGAEGQISKGTAKISSSLNIKESYVFSSIVFLSALIVSFFVLGFLPSELGFLASSASASAFVRKLTIALFKIFFILLIMAGLKYLSPLKQLFKFNDASAKSANSNYLGFMLFSLLTANFVICLVGAPVSPWLKPLINLSFLILSFSVCYEIMYIVEHTALKPIRVITLYFVTYPSSKTERDLTATALTEGSLMKNPKREEIKVLPENSLAFSYVYSYVKDELASAGIEDRSEADWLIAGALEKKRGDLRLLTSIDKNVFKNIKAVVERRKKGEPLTKIFGKADFYGIMLKVNEFVLSPRFETELLVDEALKLIGKAKAKVLDLGTGSGAIAIAIAKNSSAKVTAIDISSNALDVARENALSADVKINFLQGDMFSPLKKEKFDYIISNPPYIKSNLIDKLDKEVKDYDPRLALDGGEDGLEYYKKIVMKAPDFLAKNGKILLEIGYDQAKDIKKLFSKQKFNVRILKDYNDLDRIVIAERKEYVRKDKKDKRKV